jgi:ParB family chromosome partitioning protein
MLNLPGEIQDAMKEGRIGEGHAKYLLGIENPTKQMMLFRKILNNNLSVNDVSKEARRLGGTRQAKIKINYKDKDKEFAFREFFGTKVEIKRGRKGGQIVIDFFSDDELEGFVDKLKV